MAFAAARMILKDKRRKSKDDFAQPTRTRSKVKKGSDETRGTPSCCPFVFLLLLMLHYKHKIQSGQLEREYGVGKGV